MTRLALSMIVRDAAATLRDCLESVRGIADEVVLADTGSTDNTIAIAKQFGARVISIPWTNDFAAARNRALAEVRADWILVLDADELLDHDSSRTIRALLDDSSIAGYQVTIRNYVLSPEERVWDRPAVPNDSPIPEARPYPAYIEHENVRLFRRNSEVRFVGRVHESVGPRLQQLGLTIAPAPFFIHHFGLAASAEIRERKNRFYRELGLQKIRELPEDAQAHFELGIVEMDNFGNLAEAQKLFERACNLKPRFGVAWFFLGIVLNRRENFAEALKALAQAERQGHRTALVAEAQGDAHYNSGRFNEAARAYKTALQRELAAPQFESKLGLALLRSGQTAPGLRYLRHASELRPSAPDLHDRYIVALVWLDKIEEAAIAAETKLVAIQNPPASDFLRAASLWAKRKNWPRASFILQAGLHVHPLHPGLQRAVESLPQPASATPAATVLETTT
jgi:glycosyltransferase involved in cell wall biosynthesis